MAIILLCHTVIAVMLPGLCVGTPVAMYHPKRCPAEACGVTLSGYIQCTTGTFVCFERDFLT